MNIREDIMEAFENAFRNRLNIFKDSEKFQNVVFYLLSITIKKENS